uniref:Uncharacterized protein n=1 Tax=Globisporangium ultimum (strain ATCC 200006 / CBS 805.95 / DAOM BR144) TaxID=431595 RepID=K3WWI8_GLOUD
MNQMRRHHLFRGLLKLSVYELVIARLEDIWRQFCDASESLQSKLLVYAKIIYRFSIFMEKLEKMDVIDRLITSRKGLEWIPAHKLTVVGQNFGKSIEYSKWISSKLSWKITDEWLAI